MSGPGFTGQYRWHRGSPSLIFFNIKHGEFFYTNLISANGLSSSSRTLTESRIWWKPAACSAVNWVPVLGLLG